MADSYLIKLIKKRKSERNYDPSRKIDEIHIESMVEAARLAPSASNRQPWHFIAVKDEKILKRICSEALGGIVGNRFAGNAPVIFVLCADTGLNATMIGEKIKGIAYHQIDIGIAGEHLVLRATELGIGTCWIGWFNGKRIKAILSIPEQIKVLSLITAGYPMAGRSHSSDEGGRTGSGIDTDKGEIEKQYPVKKRKPLYSIMHRDTW